MPERARRRVLLVATSLHAGAGVYLLRVLEGLGPAGIDAVVACAPGAALDAAVAARAQRVVTLPWGRHGRVVGIVQSLFLLVRLLRRGGCDVMFTHSSLAGAVGRAAALLAGGVPVVHTVHGWACEARTAGPLRQWAIRQVERLLRPATSVFVACSRRVAQRGVELGLARSDRILPIVYDLAPWPPSDQAVARRELGLEVAAPVALFVGRFEPQKGVAVLLDAWRTVVAAHPAAVLLVAGDGRQRALVDAQVASLPAGSVRLLGWRDDIPRLLAASDVFVLSSWFEGLPITVLEAMAAGRAVVATAVDGTPEAVVDGVTGVLVQPGDAAGCAAALVRVLGDRAVAQRMGAAGRRRLETRFPAGSCAAWHVRLIRALRPGRA